MLRHSLNCSREEYFNFVRKKKQTAKAANQKLAVRLFIRKSVGFPARSAICSFRLQGLFSFHGDKPLVKADALIYSREEYFNLIMRKGTTDDKFGCSLLL